jgi:hypothetical protein
MDYNMKKHIIIAVFTLLVMIMPGLEPMVSIQLENDQESLVEVCDILTIDSDEEVTADLVIDKIQELDVQASGNDFGQIQLKTLLTRMAPHMKSLMEVIKISTLNAYKGSEWCCRNVLPPLYHSLVFILENWVVFVQNGGEFSAPKIVDKKADQKVDFKRDFRNGSSSLKLSKLENLYVLEVAKMIVKGEQISPKVRRKTITLLRKVLNYEYGDLEDLLVSYFDKVLA